MENSVVMTELTHSIDDGGLFDVTLSDSKISVKCIGIKYWDDDMLDDMFIEWCNYAIEGQDGYVFV